jgi:two-component system, cell cycle response regulator
MQKEQTFITLVLKIIGVMILFAALLIAAFRYIWIESASERAHTAASIVRESLTAHMITGSAEHQNDFLKQTSTLEGMRSIWVVRSEAVASQYGKGIHPQEPKDDIDRAILRNGKEYEEVSGSLLSDTVYRISLPYVATDKGKIDCLSCHDVKVGTTLGVVSVEMQINDLKGVGLFSVLAILTLLVVAAVLLLRMIRRFIASYKETLDSVAVTMEKAEGGDYTYRVESNETKDAHNASMWTNSLMEKLSSTLSDSGNKLGSLISIDPPNIDALYTIRTGVHQLYEVERFRKAIEDDQNLEEVYARLIALLRTRWGLSDFNILELNPQDKTTHLVHSEKTLLCDAASGCRADRTTNIVDSTQCDIACPKMIDPDAHYVCRSYPIVDDLDIVISLVTFDKRDIGKIRLALDQLNNFINASRLQIVNKKLQQSVRIDPMTKLHNRTYLEEMSALIVNQSRRTAIPYGILMIDMDNFDGINRSYGTHVGDEVIKAMGRNIAESIRQSDTLIRYGGDTFAVVLYDWDGAEVIEVAEKIRLAFKKKIRVNTYAILKTVSIGIALFPEQTADMIECIEFAKRSLLEAKHQGGNCSLVYDPATMMM